jgi:hypothetical protein
MFLADLLHGAIVTVAAVIVWFVVFWIGGAVLSAWVASEQERDPVAWFIVAFFLSAPVALVALAAAASPLGGRTSETVRAAARPLRAVSTPERASAA